ncbi:S-layer homology domain-containing protein [Alkaliphilus peptidifermentans]|uniref:S-layer homology domain-containing protein n=1 Tax=Alkaliphilus peptidifermentans DSM 18978 TaxID=1120976 RepID=A0A1G5JRQ9_9FIRM|nr:S-layer homology domain-containing protein [Alkaliphilus peptidifermentans]SCY90844.1 S-layer homology domain-containing protein [Alkaliphilus peptidifermentans DSM 18978]
MRKRLLSSVLVVCMLLLIFSSLPVFASTSVKLAISKTEFRINEKGTLTISGISDYDVENGAWLGIAEGGTRVANTNYHISVNQLPANNVWEFTAPYKFGEYEIRLINHDDTLLEKVSFSVVPAVASGSDIKLSKTEVKINEQMSVTVNGLTDGEISEGVWIGIDKEGTKMENSNYHISVYQLPANNTYEFNAPYNFGKYEVRVIYPDEKNTAFGRASFVVESSKAKPGDLVLSNTKPAYGEKIALTVKGLTKGEIDEGAWIGVAKVGDKLINTNYHTTIKYLPQNNVYEFIVENEPGNYEVRVFCKDNLAEDEMEYGLFGTVGFTVGTASATGIVAGYEGISSWAVPEINEAIENNLITDKVMVDFGRDITREEFCELAIKLYEKMSGKTAQPSASNPFTDTKNPEVLKAYNLGIVQGVAPDKFAPNNSITRQEIATMLVRTLKNVMPELETSGAQFTQVFYDAAEISDWAVENLRFLNHNDIFKGSQGYILPKAYTTREQAISLVKRVFDKFFQI